jgi:hypothetical protein
VTRPMAVQAKTSSRCSLFIIALSILSPALVSQGHPRNGKWRRYCVSMPGLKPFGRLFHGWGVLGAALGCEGPASND